MHPNNIAIVGSAGAIGQAFTLALAKNFPDANLHLFSRTNEAKQTGNMTYHALDYENELDVKSAAEKAAEHFPLDLVIVTIGMLHDENIMPERSIHELSAEKFQTLFMVNTILPALVGKHFIPKLNKQSQSAFLALSARVGSISDNRLGGWHAYRASKAALNMTIKNLAIETARKNTKAIIATLHPGTVDSQMSKPFQRHVKEGQLFTPEYSVRKMLDVIARLTPAQSGKCFAWDGKEIEP